MSELDSAIAGLIDALRNTQVYKSYEAERKKVNQFPELKTQINDFRIRNYELQNMSDDEELFYKIEEFETEYEKFRENSIVSDFLAAELAFCRMMQEMNNRITSELDFE